MPALRIRPLSREEVRGIDARAAEEFGMPSALLMENAGRGAAEVLRERMGEHWDLANGDSPRVLVLCGPGNNGGDGGVAARWLDFWGVSVRVVWLAKPEILKGDAALQWRIVGASGIAQVAWSGEDGDMEAEIEGSDWVVDGLFGTGLTRPVAGVFAAWIHALNRSGKPVLALDLPSGLDADTGEILGVAVRAALTATFVAPKLGFASAGAPGYTGDVVVIDIGAPRRLLEAFQVSAEPE